MVNSVDVNLIRRLCDKAGLKTIVSDNGTCVLVVLDADNDFGHDVTFMLSPDNDGQRFDIFAYGGVKVSQDKLAEALMRINQYHRENVGIRAYISTDMEVMTVYTVWVGDGVSEEFLLEGVIRSILVFTWQFFKNNFSDYVK